jgi:hypothetical protein
MMQTEHESIQTKLLMWEKIIMNLVVHNVSSQHQQSDDTSLSDEVEDQDEVHFNSNRVAAESWRLQFKINIVLKLYFDL